MAQPNLADSPRPLICEMPARPIIWILQEQLPKYRVPFFEQLRRDLDGQGLALVLTHAPAASASLIPGRLPWACPAPFQRCGPLVWQRVLSRARTASLIITPQESKYVFVPLLLFLRRWGGWKFAFWGHGKNFQARNPASLSERWKKFLSRRADWWFAYNDLSAGVVRDLGFPAGRITTVMNSVDTATLTRLRATVTPSRVQGLKEAHGIRSENVVIYTGGLYPGKRIPFLLEACRLARRNVPDLTLLVIGLGPEAGDVERAAQTEPWIRYLGPMHDAEKAPFWAMSKLLLMPGGVGVVAVDSFALEVPMVTTACPHLHGPEIDYLQDGRNARVVADWGNPAAYAQTMVTLLQDEAARRSLVQGCRQSAADFSVEKMSRRFCDGVIRCLASSPL